MANKEEFLNGLFDSFYVYDSKNHKIRQCTLEDGKLSAYDSGFKFIETNLPQSQIHEIEEMYFLNNMYQRGWNHPVMTIYQDSLSEINDGKIGGEIRSSLRDKLHLIKSKYKTPILHMEDILETIEKQTSSGNNFSANLYRIEFPRGIYSPQEEKVISNYLMNKNDFSQIEKRKCLNLELADIESK